MWGWKWKSLSCVQLFVTPWTIQSMEFLGQNTGVGSLSLLQGIFPTQGLNSGLCQNCSLQTQWLSKDQWSKEIWTQLIIFFSFPDGSDWKKSAYNEGDLSSIPGLGRSLGEGNGHPLQHSCLKNPMDRRAWWATVHGITKSWKWLCN